MPAKKKVPPTAPKRQRVVKPFNAGTMSNAAFWSFIRAGLRQKSRWWKPITQCKQAAKRAYKGANKRQKVEFKCNICKNYFPDKQVSVDHITPCGELNTYPDLPGFVQRLFVEIDGLQTICRKCHDAKTKLEKETRKNK